ncbi:MAG: hypothetical protein WA908_05955 [Pontixanthobacter sp.]
MSDTNFASLSSGLLARKGGAKPAMRPQVAMMPSDGAAAHNLEDLGWNDMGEVSDASTIKQKEGTILHLTPEPANRDAAQEAQDNDRLAAAELGEQHIEAPTVVEQQKSLGTMFAGADDNDDYDLDDDSGYEGDLTEEPVDHKAPEIEAAPTPEIARNPEPEPLSASEQKPAPIRKKVKAKETRTRRSALARGKRAAFTLRLDADRHLKLRLACTLRNVSAQQMVTDALDRMLGDMPEISNLANQANPTTGPNSDPTERASNN